MIDLEDVGLGAIAKAVRFFVNIKNFPNLSAWGKVRTVSVPLLLVGGAAFVMGRDGIIVEKMELSEIDQVVMAKCVDNHKSGDMRFDGMVSVDMGCACTAKLVTSATPVKHLTSFRSAHGLVLESYTLNVSGETEEEQLEDLQKQVLKKVDEIATMQRFNRDNYKSLVLTTSEADEMCNSDHMYKGENLEKLASLAPFQDPIWEDPDAGVVEIKLRGAEETLRLSQN